MSPQDTSDDTRNTTTSNNTASSAEIQVTQPTNNNASATTNSSLDSHLMMSLMERLQRYPSLLNTNSFLSQPLEDLFLSLSDHDDEEEDDHDEANRSEKADFRARVAKEESKLERELIRIINSGNIDSLKPNSGQAVTIRDAHICVGFHVEHRHGYRVWEWHGHVLLYDEEQGYSPEYIYGNYFEKVALNPKDSDDQSEEKDDSSFASSGLRELIDGGSGLNGRIVRRNMSAGGRS